MTWVGIPASGRVGRYALWRTSIPVGSVGSGTEGAPPVLIDGWGIEAVRAAASGRGLPRPALGNFT